MEALRLYEIAAAAMPDASLMDVLSTFSTIMLICLRHQAGDAFVLPSHGEGWGLPLMEAMAMELPNIY